MSFNGSEGEGITLSEASSSTSKYRSSYPNQPKAFFIGSDLINEILNQDDCQGIRIYMGEKKGDFQLITVGADSNENDILDLIVDRAKLCPPCCGEDNDLNS